MCVCITFLQISNPYGIEKKKNRKDVGHFESALHLHICNNRKIMKTRNISISNVEYNKSMKRKLCNTK